MLAYECLKRLFNCLYSLFQVASNKCSKKVCAELKCKVLFCMDYPFGEYMKPLVLLSSFHTMLLRGLTSPWLLTDVLDGTPANTQSIILLPLCRSWADCHLTQVYSLKGSECIWIAFNRTIHFIMWMFTPYLGLEFGEALNRRSVTIIVFLCYFLCLWDDRTWPP